MDPCVWAIYHEKMYTESGTNPRKMNISGSQVGGAEPFKFFNTRHSARRCGISTAGFQFCSGPIFPQNTFISVSWNCNIKSVSFYVRSVGLSFDFKGETTRFPFVSKESSYS